MNDWSEDNFLERLTPQLRNKADGAKGPCPDAETLLAVIEGAASELLRNTVNEHLSKCAACAELRSRLLSFESASPPEPEAVWNQTATRLNNWMEGFLRSEAAARSAKGGKPSPRVFSWENVKSLFTPRKSIWALGVALGVALALVLIVGAPLLLKYRRQLLSPVQVAVRAPIPLPSSNPASVANPPVTSTEQPKATPPGESLPKAANNASTKAESPNTPKAGEPSAPLAPAAPADSNPPSQMAQIIPHPPPALGPALPPAPSDRNLPVETAEARLPPPPNPPYRGHVMAAGYGAPLPQGVGNPRTLQLYPDGRVATIRAIGMTINYRPDGGRTIMSEQNGRTLVSTGPHSGYAERHYIDHNGHAYYQRTYWDHGHAYARVYRDHFYHGEHYYQYVPVYYYHPVFYGWAYDLWGSRVYYKWGWGPAPWFYGGYFAPAPFYPSASLWLTDYLLAEDLKQAYELKQEAQASADSDRAMDMAPEGGAAATPMSPEVKEMIDAEVQRQLAEEMAAAQSPQAAPPRPSDEVPLAALDPKHRLFVVSSNLGVGTADGQECKLTPGDVIIRLDDVPGNDNKVRISVISSKVNDCSISAMPLVAVDDLQEMHNTFQEEVDSGLQILAEKSGTGGLPKAPDPGTTNGEVLVPSPDRGVADQLVALQVRADEAEYGAADRAQNSGDLNAALAEFKILAGKPGPMQAQAQLHMQQVMQLIANAGPSGGPVGISTDRPREGLEHGPRLVGPRSTMRVNATGGAGPAHSPATPKPAASRPAMPPKSPAPPPK